MNSGKISSNKSSQTGQGQVLNSDRMSGHAIACRWSLRFDDFFVSQSIYLKWPISVSPFEVVIIPSFSKNDSSNLKKAMKVYDELKGAGIDVLLDDEEDNMANKFKKHDLIGIPFQIILGSKSQKDKYEFKEIDGDSKMLDLSNILTELKKYFV